MINEDQDSQALADAGSRGGIIKKLCLTVAVWVGTLFSLSIPKSPDALAPSQPRRRKTNTCPFWGGAALPVWLFTGSVVHARGSIGPPSWAMCHGAAYPTMQLLDIRRHPDYMAPCSMYMHVYAFQVM